MKPQIVTMDDRKAKARAQQRDWYVRNAEKKKAYARAWYAANREVGIANAQEYRKKKPHVTLASRLRCQYGLTLTEYNSMQEKQNYSCAICGLLLDSRTKISTPHVDHCHTTGMVRGILCAKCNTSLGYLERPGFLPAALAYLEKK